MGINANNKSRWGGGGGKEQRAELGVQMGGFAGGGMGSIGLLLGVPGDHYGMDMWVMWGEWGYRGGPWGSILWVTDGVAMGGPWGSLWGGMCGNWTLPGVTMGGERE